MDDHDARSEHGISGRFRSHSFDAADGNRFGGDRARLYLGDLGDVGHLSGLAERPSGFVRCGLECTAREHRAHGVGILFAVKGRPSLHQ